jgi:hypothetical protein
MTDVRSHLSEEQRHALADGSLPLEQLPTIEAHLRGCAACVADITRIRTLLLRVHGAPAPVPPPLDELWPSIRTRIEARKVVPLWSQALRLDGRRRLRLLGVPMVMAVALVVAVVALGSRRSARRPAPGAEAQATASLIAVADSAHAYEEEAQTLLAQLELRRAMLRPEAVSAIDHDLRVVDAAIAELKQAIARDPGDPGLRRLLAASYRQKVDVLKRVGNAG